jgi:hypothetical protein
MGYRLGVVHIVYGDRPVEETARLAAADGFVHLDAMADTPDDLVLPLADRFAMRPTSGCTSGPAPHWTWERTAAAFRAAPGCRMEPHGRSCVNSNEAVLAMIDEVPGLRLTLDVGHVASWGGDPVELVPHADHVQLRQAREGVVQSLDGDVDFAAVIARLSAVGYAGVLSVEYFDLPELGYPLDDPRGFALEIAARVRPLLN